jgi:protein ImuB
VAPLARRRVVPAPRPSLAVPAAAPTPAVVASARPRELWLAVHLPALLLDALREQVAALPGQPLVAVVDLERDGKVVRACAPRVRAAGVHAGMSINSALALLPSLQTLAREPRREKALLETIARRSLHFTPRVSLEPPDAVLLEVRGSLRLFGGARALCQRLRHELTETTGATVRIAITPAPLASLWFARVSDDDRTVLVRSREELGGRLASLPLAACTRWPERTLQTLATMGVHTVGECLRLPRDGFARRFGADLLAMLDRATGRLAEPRSGFAAHEKFALRRELEPELDDTARLQVVLEPMIGELCRFLRERSRGIQALEVQLRHREAPVTRVRLRFVQPIGAQPRRIAELLRERLARLALTEPVRNVRLVSGPLLDLQADAAELFAHDRRESGENLPALIERLRARLGNEAVHGLACVAEHRPEAAWRAVEPLSTSPAAAARIARSAGGGSSVTSLASAGEVAGEGFSIASPASPGEVAGEGFSVASPASAGEVARSAGEGSASEGILRPLWLLDVPEPCDASRLEFEEGPECIESGWWDGHDVARDYFVARDRHGARLWLCRDRRAADDATRWFVQGWFA